MSAPEQATGKNAETNCLSCFNSANTIIVYVEIFAIANDDVLVEIPYTDTKRQRLIYSLVIMAIKGRPIIIWRYSTITSICFEAKVIYMLLFIFIVPASSLQAQMLDENCKTLLFQVILIFYV